MRFHQILLSLASIFFPVVMQVAAAENWPEFRGPTGDGQASESLLPSEITEESVAWKVPIHGKGWSSPVVWGDQIWLTTAKE